MPTDLITERICEAVRKSFLPDCAITFDTGSIERGEVPIWRSVVAWVAGDHLPPFFDRGMLVSLIGGTIEVANDDLVLMTGNIEGSECRLTLKATGTTGLRGGPP